MSEIDATLIKDGQKVVATVSQSGTIISDPSAVDATALVQTDNGPQLCVKTIEMGEGGGGGGTVDQTYDPTSTNAQSGTAVAEAVEPALKNTATGNNSLTILGTPTNYTGTINIGYANNTAWSVNTISLGNSITNYGSNDVTIGNSASGGGTGVTIGTSANSASFCVTIGAYANANRQKSIAIGSGTRRETAAQANANEAIQIGTGINSTDKTLQVYEYPLLDGNTGKIPMARLPIVQCTQAEYDALVSGGTVDANTIYCIIPA